jgi:RNA-directed DNA polymerase
MDQKNKTGKQLNLFRDTVKPEEDKLTGGTGTLPTGDAMLSRLKEQRVQTENLLERIVDYGNLTRAYNQVVNNKGRGGIDEMNVKELRPWMGNNHLKLRQAILEEKYEVSPVRKVEIPKPTGGLRMLGIPTVRDRLIQQAIHQQLSCYYDPHFSESSFGFRPNRNAQQAILQAAEYIKAGKEWVVDIDLEKFFDTINHDRLMQRLSKGIGDKRLLRLINAYLKAGMMEGGVTEQRIAGTPQGGPLSPLLSNIVLDELDKELEHRNHSFCRYADDCNIYVKSRKAGERVMASVINFIERKLKLKVNRSKSGVRHCSDVKFLGYTLLSGGGIRVADKSITRLKDKVREITQRSRGVRFERVIFELNQVIVGWSNYFGRANKWLATNRDIDGWIRRRLRCYRLMQLRRKYTIYKFLRSLNIPENTSWNVVMYSQNWWNMTSKTAVNKAMGIEWFARQGLYSLSLRMKV